MQHRTLGMAALTAGLGLLTCLGTANAQCFFDYTTVYNSGTSGNISSGGGTTTLPGPPTDTTHPFFTVTPVQNTSGGATPTNISLLTLTAQTGSLGLADTTSVPVNQPFSLAITVYKTDAAGTRLGPNATGTYNATFAGTLTNNSDTVTVTPNPGVSPTAFTLTSGDCLYMVNVNSFTPPGFPGGANQTGTLSATVLGSSAVPEPGPIALLLGTAVPGTLFALRLRRKR